MIKRCVGFDGIDKRTNIGEPVRMPVVIADILTAKTVTVELPIITSFMFDLLFSM